MARSGPLQQRQSASDIDREAVNREIVTGEHQSRLRKPVGIPPLDGYREPPEGATAMETGGNGGQSGTCTAAKPLINGHGWKPWTHIPRTCNERVVRSIRIAGSIYTSKCLVNRVPAGPQPSY